MLNVALMVQLAILSLTLCHQDMVNSTIIHRYYTVHDYSNLHTQHDTANSTLHYYFFYLYNELARMMEKVVFSHGPNTFPEQYKRSLIYKKKNG